ncbi:MULTISPECIES: ABC transporter permease [Paenibacillus]|uniref:ABC transporter permease n=1 Tax=Paenibacillus lautus TaxID=1401 RepID=A0A385TUH6_PAELA|nr:MULTISPECIES: ABC transporter permease [Paenibacillus]AWP25199.1 ABC transporter permease [Paenibacillus sp. Cedars]AYB48030.1 ABC transporter permease [Paenibacillus lautus]MBX4152586.1 ABC transporter permease [Paenibacillus lautus]VTR62921.1 Uncharacterised protein [Actinobacillus pleuropneumoniae]
MEENPNLALRIAAGIFFTVLLITIVAMLTMSSQDATKQGQSKITTITTQISNTEYNTYNNASMSGSQVLNAVRQYMDQEHFGIQVTTGKGATTFYGNTFNPNDGTVVGGPKDKNKNISTAEDPALDTYVNPSGKYSSRVVRDQNNVIVGLVFQQL